MVDVESQKDERAENQGDESSGETAEKERDADKDKINLAPVELEPEVKPPVSGEVFFGTLNSILCVL